MEHSRKYHRVHRNELNAYMKEYRKNNPEKFRKYRKIQKIRSDSNYVIRGSYEAV